MPERATVLSRSEKSAEAIVVGGDPAKGRRSGRNSSWVIETGEPQMFTTVKLATKLVQVNPA